MRIKINKGCTPEVLANILLYLLQEHCGVIGTVNVYVQCYDKDMNLIKYNDEEDYIEIEPDDDLKRLYSDYIAEYRRNRLRVM